MSVTERWHAGNDPHALAVIRHVGPIAGLRITSDHALPAMGLLAANLATLLRQLAIPFDLPL